MNVCHLVRNEITFVHIKQYIKEKGKDGNSLTSERCGKVDIANTQITWAFVLEPGLATTPI